MNCDNAAERSRRDATEEPPPIFKTWRGMYFAVIGNLALLIVLFYLIARVFS